MVKRDSYSEEVSGIVDFVLRANRVSSSWRILDLDEDEWRRVCQGKSNLDQQAQKRWAKLEKEISDPKVVDSGLPTLLKLKEFLRLRRQGFAEYGVALNYTENLEADAMHVSVVQTLASAREIRLAEPFIVSLAEQNNDVDSLILINSVRFSNLTHVEKLITLTHETLHLVEMKKGIQKSSFQSIETRARKLVHDFERQGQNA